MPFPDPSEPLVAPSEPYLVREYSAKRMLWVPLLAAFAVGSYLFSRELVHASGLSLVWGIVLAAFMCYMVLRPESALKVDATGVRLGEVKVPWSSLRQVVITPSVASTGSPSALGVGLRLRRGAPLPDGMSGVVYDPSDPDAVMCERSFRAGKVDPARLAAAVRAFGRAEVVESWGGTERRIG